MILVACYMTGHCRLGPFMIPREDELEDCPLCGKLYLDDHFIYDCVAFQNIRNQFLNAGVRGLRIWGGCVAKFFSLGELSSCGARVTCNFGGILVVGHCVSSRGWICIFLFNLCGFPLDSFLGYWDLVRVHYGPWVTGPNVSPCDLFVCAHINKCHDMKFSPYTIVMMMISIFTSAPRFGDGDSIPLMMMGNVENLKMP